LQESGIDVDGGEVALGEYLRDRVDVVDIIVAQENGVNTADTFFSQKRQYDTTAWVLCGHGTGIEEDIFSSGEFEKNCLSMTDG